MTPTIKHLKKDFFGNSFGLDDVDPLNWTFSKKIQSLTPDFYHKIVSSHLVFNLEYSLLGQQIRKKLLSDSTPDKDQLITQLVSALLLAELLEHVYEHYLIVPREVTRLRKQQEIYHTVLSELVMLPAQMRHAQIESDSSFSYSQQIREGTFNLNLYRLIFVRSKRALDMFAAAEFSSDWYRQAIGRLDKHSGFFFTHLSWLFFTPRLVVNLGLLIKHTIPGPWMKNSKERDLPWTSRFGAQMQRRWFELGNDLVWVSIGLVQCFVLTGALAPLIIYLSVTFLTYDVLLSFGRVCVELNRLYTLRQQYTDMLDDKDVDRALVKEHLKAIQDQIKFEAFRLGSHFLSTIGILLSIACALPIIAALNPVVPLVGAVFLVLICVTNLALVPFINNSRPKDIIEIPKESEGGVKKLGFFAKPPKISEPEPTLENRFDPPPCLCF